MRTFREAIFPPVFVPAVACIAFLTVGAIFVPEPMARLIQGASDLFIGGASWLYILSMSGFLAIAIILCTSSRIAQIRLGPDDSRPEFSFGTWLAMLFSAGMGIGLLFYGVAEPLMHFHSPIAPEEIAGKVAAAKNSLGVTLFHWGLHPWACYSMVGLALAYFSFRKGQPLTFRSALEPVLGRWTHGWIGHAVDVVAIVSTLFGVATSLGLGSMQINAGFEQFFGIEESRSFQVIAIIVITAMATVSVISGLSKGIRFLSETNMALMGLFAILLFLLGPTAHLMHAVVDNVSHYLNTIISNSFWTASLNANRQEWLGSWTVFYWAWWVSWAPFVGMFLARISKGRTIREFLIGTLLVPTLLSLVWFTLCGSSAIYFEMHQGVDFSAVLADSVPQTLYVFLEQFPLATLLQGIATVSIVLFFVTSSDSASLVIDMIAAGGKPHKVRSVKIFWACCEGGIAATLLLLGGLNMLQSAAIVAALPFCLVLILGVWGLWRALHQEPGVAPPKGHRGC